ncbi:hypothetical protein sphantq_02956 [Sphingobium sp. AntQ-1]|uniref:DUF1376 domain-containing protein n=1 Tax=Sphingobium sp. AntQ-1 TaxID=2930091 RepID=UPI00234F6D8A|nr:DUF1376 domain-containing protein [Sphingobium sp. AntQ-1]WCP14510.1 hypothetical protein sphantq_02956 [Sphingobium sp. AntQ-1]
MTDPLTPADCDLRGLPFMPLDVTRLADSDLFALSSGDEFKAAIALWCKCWLQIPAASLPDDDRVLAHLSGAGAKWKKVKSIALRGFVKCSDGRLYHKVVAEKANDAWERRSDWQEKQNNKNERQQRWRIRLKEIAEQLRGLGVTPPSGASLSTLERLLVDATPSTAPSTVDQSETALTGTGTGTGTGTVIPLSNDNGRPADSDTVFWTNAKDYLRPHVKTDPGSLVGKWSRDFGKVETAQAITDAQVARPVSPVQYIEKILRKAKTQAEQDDEMPIC